MKHIAVKSLLSVMLSLMMVVVFTPAIAFADEPETTDEIQVTEPAIEDAFGGDVLGSPDLGKNNDPVKAGTFKFVVNPVKTVEDFVNTSDEQASSASFTKEDPKTNNYYCVQKVRISAGVVGVMGFLLANTEKLTAKAKFGIFYDKNCKKPVHGTMTIKETKFNPADMPSFSRCFFKIPKTRDYYLAVGATEAGWSTADSMEIQMAIWRFPKAKSGTTLKTNKVYGVISGKGKTTTLKFKPAYSGTLGAVTDHPVFLRSPANSKVKIRIRNSSGKLLGTQANTAFPAYFGVRAKKHYKLSFTTSKKSTTRGYVVMAFEYKTPNQSGASKARAKVLKFDSDKQGRIFAGSTKSQWFKFKVTEEFPTGLKCEAATNNKIKFQLYKGKTLLKTTYVKQTTEESYLMSGEALKTGTYYIKVTPVKKSSGAYRISWEDMRE